MRCDYKFSLCRAGPAKDTATWIKLVINSFLQKSLGRPVKSWHVSRTVQRRVSTWSMRLSSHTADCIPSLLLIISWNSLMTLRTHLLIGRFTSPCWTWQNPKERNTLSRWSFMLTQLTICNLPISRDCLSNHDDWNLLGSNPGIITRKKRKEFTCYLFSELEKKRGIRFSYISPKLIKTHPQKI